MRKPNNRFTAYIRHEHIMTSRHSPLSIQGPLPPGTYLLCDILSTKVYETLFKGHGNEL